MGAAFDDASVFQQQDQIGAADGGAAHAKDSNDVAFRLAATGAVRDALRKAKPQLLEPVMAVEVDTLGEAPGRRARRAQSAARRHPVAGIGAKQRAVKSTSAALGTLGLRERRAQFKSGPR